MAQENMHSNFDIISSSENLSEGTGSLCDNAIIDNLPKPSVQTIGLNALKNHIIKNQKNPYEYFPLVFDLMGLEISTNVIQSLMNTEDIYRYCESKLNSLFDGQLYFGGCKVIKVNDNSLVAKCVLGRKDKIGEKIMENIKYIYKSLSDIVFYQYDTITQSNVIDFCDKIMTKGDLEGISWQCVNGEKRKYWMSHLKTRISVKLVEAKDMPKPYIPKSYESKETDTELLGCYFSKTMEILLCPERIKNASNNLYNNLKPEDKTNISQDYCEQVIFAMVLIHEFAHAVLDPTNLADRTISKPVFDYNIDEELRFFLEESLANMIMLKYFDASFGGDSNEFIMVTEFVKGQSYAYSFGLNMYEAKVDWSLWRDKKSILSQKTSQQQQCLKDLIAANTDTDALKNVYEQLFIDEPGE